MATEEEIKQLDKIPIALRTQKRWVCVRESGEEETIHRPDGSPADILSETTWSSFKDCVTGLATNDFNGLAYVLDPKAPYYALKVPCSHSDEEEISKWVQKFVDQFKTYTEWSSDHSSLTLILLAARGYHIFFDHPDSTSSAELTSQGYIRLTGQIHGGYTNIEECDNDLNVLCWDYFGDGTNGSIESTGALDEGDYPYTLIGNLDRFVDHCNGLYLYFSQQKCWFVYDGSVWVRTDQEIIDFEVDEMVKTMCEQAKETGDHNLLKFAEETLKTSTILARKVRARLVADHPRRSRRITFNNIPHLLNVKNGTIDLRTGELIAHSPDHFSTQIVQVDYDPVAVSSLWNDTLNHVTKGNQELVTFLQSWFGYCITGDTSAKLFAIIWGQTQTGKSTVTEPIQRVLGAYAKRSNIETFLASSADAGGSKPRSDIVRLQDARLVTTAEAPAKRSFAVDRLKAIVSGDIQTYRAAFKEEIEFKPQLKLVLVVNDIPSFPTGDEAVWQRTILIPFTNTVKKIDNNRRKMLEEDPEVQKAILNWLIRGSVRWYKEGLKVPKVSTHALEDLRKKRMTKIDMFLQTCCDLDTSNTIAVGEINSAYEAFCKKLGYSCTKTELAKELTARGYTQPRSSKVRMWQGIKLKT